MEPVEECRLCNLPLPCDPSIHRATIAVHEHLRARMVRLFQPVPAPKLRTEGFQASHGLVVAALKESRRRGSRRGGANATRRVPK
jgi:hypothetical protein